MRKEAITRVGIKEKFFGLTLIIPPLLPEQERR